MFLYQNAKDIYLDKVSTKWRDILLIRGSVRWWKVQIIIVYFRVNDRVRNHSMKTEIERIIEANNEEPLLIIGDFNGHVGFNGPQKIDENGKMILEWMEKISTYNAKWWWQLWRRIHMREREPEKRFKLCTRVRKFLWQIYKHENRWGARNSRHYGSQTLRITTLLRLSINTLIHSCKTKWKYTEHYKTDKKSLQEYKRKKRVCMIVMYKS